MIGNSAHGDAVSATEAHSEQAQEQCVPSSYSTAPVGRPSICFVALNAYNLLSGRDDIEHTGGAEVQQVRMGRWLAERGYTVSFVTLDHGQADGVRVGAIQVFKAYAKEAGTTCIRFMHPRWSGLWRALNRANADVYYQRGAGCESGQVGLWCYLHRRRFIFAAASEANCDPDKLSLKPLRERILYRVGLRLANVIVAQTQTQQDLFTRNFGLSTVLIRNSGWPLTDYPRNGKAARIGSGGLRVLWVGRIAPVKRFEWLLDLAQRCPEIHFDVVGGSCGAPSASVLMERAQQHPNVVMHGRIPYREIASYYERCHVVCCTSRYEGFPNTFLEAWSYGVPVVSTFDPDGVIVGNGLGAVANDLDGLVRSLRSFAGSAQVWKRTSEAARRYYVQNHVPDACLPAFERLCLAGATGTEFGLRCR